MLGEILALSCALSWSLSILLFRRSEAASPLAINLFKNVVASLLMGATLVAIGGHLDLERSAADWLSLVASGVLGISLADTLFFTALRRLGPSRLAVVETAYSPIVVLLSVVMLGEPLGLAFIGGGVLVAAGVLLVSAASGQGAPASKGGALFGVLAVAIMAFGIVLAKPALERGALIEVTLIRLVSGTAGQVVWFALSPAARPALGVLRPQRLWLTLGPATVLGGWLSMILWMGGYQLTHASTAAVLNQTTTVFTIGLAWLVLGERLNARQITGSAIALAGVLVVMLGRA